MFVMEERAYLLKLKFVFLSNPFCLHWGKLDQPKLAVFIQAW